MKIVHLAWYPRIGGAELFALRLAQHQSKYEEHQITLIYLGATETDIGPGREGSLEILAMGLSSGFDIAGLLRLSRHLAQQSYDVIHIHQSPVTVLSARTGGKGAVIVKHEHGRSSVQHRSRRQRLLGRLFSAGVDLYIANSEYTRDELARDEGIRLRRVRVVKGGIDTEVFNKDTKSGVFRAERGYGDTRLVLFLGRLVWEKGIEEFLEVANLVYGSSPNTKFVVVGDGPMRLEVESMLCSCPVRNNVDLLGFRDDVASIMRDCDVFLMTSRKEAQGLTVLESMACGLPVVSFDTGGLAEVVGDAGILVANRSTGDMAEQVKRLLNDTVLREKLQRRANAHVRKYCYQVVVERIFDIYQEILKKS